MNLKEYLKHLNKIVEKNPEALEYEVIYSKDEEGNAFEEVFYKPSIGFLDDENEYTAIDSEDWIELEEQPNVICIN